MNEHGWFSSHDATGLGQGPKKVLGTVLVGVVVAYNLTCVSAQTDFDTEDDLAAVMQQDATLADVHFVNPRQGWAVGDRGVIWHTRDGGDEWSQQVSGATGDLTSVFFLNETTGWAVGGTTDPYTHLSHGVVLHTNDGGRKWLQWKRAALPALLHVEFLDAKQGWAIGQNSDMYPHGLFTTDDNGRTWTPVPLDGHSVWNCGDFSGPRTGLVAGRYGILGKIEHRRIASTNSKHGSVRSLSDLVLMACGDAIAVGQGGLVLVSSDSGATWQDRSELLSDGDHADFDLKTVAARGSHIWTAGSPGTCVFHSSDRGKTWKTQPTGQRLPIGSLHFVNEQQGWAVGALGTILATQDGGVQWEVQRRAGRRAAWLGIFTDADQIPLEMVAQLSAGQGYFGAVTLLGRRDNGPRAAGQPYAFDRSREALIDVGASYVEQAWQFPLRDDRLAMPASNVVHHWEHANASRRARPGLELLEEEITQQIRIWQPDVVITLPASPKGEEPLSHLVNQAVLRAVTRASEPNTSATPSPIPTLAPWRVKKVYASLPPRTLGTIRVTADQLIPAIGRSLSDFVAVPRGLLLDANIPPRPVQRFQLLVDHLPQGQGRRDFFSGFALKHGGGARRKKVRPAQVDLAQLKRAASRRQIVRTLVASSSSVRTPAGAWLAQITSLTADMDPVTAGEVLFQLGNRYRQEGQWSLASDSFERLATEYPQHAFAPAALRWLLQYYASAEVEHIRRDSASFAARQIRASTSDLNAHGVVTLDEAPTGPATNGSDRAAKAILFANMIKRSQIMLSVTPEVIFPWAAAYRHAKYPREAERLYLAMARSRSTGPWRACAQDELTLANKASTATQSPKRSRGQPIWVCRQATGKPKLDGRLEEPIWQRAMADGENEPQPHGVALRDPAAAETQWPARVMLTYDDEFLYLGIACRRAEGTEYPTSDKPRLRDADLTQHDRVDFFFDIDRDRCTYFRLSVDHRGWTAESCWGHRGWNPTWYVAAGSTEDAWTCEAAIPLDELTSTPPTSKDRWSVGVQRTIPGVGFQSWTTPADCEILPEGFGTLTFE